MQIDVRDPPAMEALGQKLASFCPEGGVVFLQGELGAGKTTCVRGFLRGLGYCGNVKSPTYTLVEPYKLRDHQVYHFDLYRIADPLELESIGVRDYFDDQAICLIEWPERAKQQFPTPDLWLKIDYQPDNRRVELTALTARGETILQQIRPAPA